jgi:hypothetical protein
LGWLATHRVMVKLGQLRHNGRRRTIFQVLTRTDSVVSIGLALLLWLVTTYHAYTDWLRELVVAQRVFQTCNHLYFIKDYLF